MLINPGVIGVLQQANTEDVYSLEITREVDSFLFLMTSVGFCKLVNVTCLIIYDLSLQDTHIQRTFKPTNTFKPVTLTMQLSTDPQYPCFHAFGQLNVPAGNKAS